MRDPADAWKGEDPEFDVDEYHKFRSRLWAFVIVTGSVLTFFAWEISKFAARLDKLEGIR